ncbi:MAG: hypothetical protein JO355_03400 [Planctomycetaceae bacterium]|nr:hypothetical protein [Planctomycetaceae bacterium]
MVLHLLRSLSSSVEIVVNRREALEHQEYDVVRMDVLMREMDDLEAAR